VITVLIITRRQGTHFPFVLLRPEGTPSYGTTHLALKVVIYRLHNYKYEPMYYVLEVSTDKPTQFRVSVVKDGPDVPGDPAFIYIGSYTTPELLTEALEPYLQMEEGSA